MFTEMSVTGWEHYKYEFSQHSSKRKALHNYLLQDDHEKRQNVAAKHANNEKLH